MEVVTYLTSTLIVAMAISLVVFGVWFDTTRRRRGLHLDEPESAWLPAGDHASHAEPMATAQVTPAAPGDSSLDGFVFQHAPVERDLHVYGRLAVFGAVLQPVTVHSGGQLVLFGPCIAPVRVRRGGRAVLYGVMTGDLTNDGGDIEVFGAITGAIHEHAGKAGMPSPRAACEA